MFPLEDTITAIASAHSLNGLRGIVRLSGPNSLAVLEQIGISFPDFYANTVSELQEQGGNQPFLFDSEFSLGEGVSAIPARILCWPGSRSYTGQNAAEIHTLGVLPFLEKLTEVLCRTGMVRLAQPGEFTLRAFLSGRLDLTQAEAVLGTIDAQDPKRLEAALHQLAGGLALPLQNLRDDLFDLLGHLEAGFDFADEDIEFISAQELTLRLENASSVIRGILDKMRSRGSSETLPRLVLYGPPNIGKSALFNALLGKEAALVFDHPGTTRDYLAAPLELNGNSCLLVDTAGDFSQLPLNIERKAAPALPDDSFSGDSLNLDFQSADSSSADFLNETSQQLARSQKELADFPLFCFDTREFIQIRPEIVKVLQERLISDSDSLILLTRSDLVSSELIETFISSLPTAFSRKIQITSSFTGRGLSALRNVLGQLLSERAGDESDVVSSTQTRCRESLLLALESLERAQFFSGTEFQELIAAEVRVALDQIGLMVGAIYTEDLLDSIFSRFCVGK